MSDAVGAMFGVAVAIPADMDAEALIVLVRTEVEQVAAHGGSAAFAAAAGRELARIAGASGELADDRPLSGLWPGWRGRRRAWRVVRRHIAVPRLGLPDGVRLALLLPSVVAGVWLAAAMRPDLGSAVFTWAPLALINLMLVAVVERLAGWRFPPALATLADLARRLRESPHDHPWTSGRIRLRVGEILDAGGSAP